MMRSLRKRHLQIWSAWALLLPAGITLAWLAIPYQQPVKLLQTPAQELLPAIIQTKEHDDYTLNIRSDHSHTVWQLEWKNKTTLNYPSAVIYKTTVHNNDPEKAELVGRIEARGDYIFELSPVPHNQAGLKFILYDFIHEAVIDTFIFKNPFRGPE
ncbi:MAG: hypothetical protein JNK14_01760 [Chitinophagaceae bacterium]|nr:hypothetical protein [Chitinophagaceae bacterium]